MVKCTSAFLSKPRIFLGLGCQHGPNMDPCWHPKSMKTRKKRVPEGVRKALHFGTRFHVILVPSWPPTWPQVGALDGPRRRPRAPKRRPRRPPRRSKSRPERTFLDFGEFFGNRSPRTSQNDPRNLPKSLENC